MTDLSKKTKLAPRNAPYWQRLAACKFVGVRVGSRGRVWMAKYDADERHQKRLAAVDYEAAVQEAWAWFKTIDQGVLGAHAETVEDALVVHWKYLDRVKAGAGSNRYRLQKHLPARILRMPIDRLSEKMIRDWHESMIVEGAGDDKKRTSMDSANRTLSALKAALNRATKGASGWLQYLGLRSVWRQRLCGFGPGACHAVRSGGQASHQFWCQSIRASSRPPRRPEWQRLGHGRSRPRRGGPETGWQGASGPEVQPGR